MPAKSKQTKTTVNASSEAPLVVQVAEPVATPVVEQTAGGKTKAPPKNKKVSVVVESVVEPVVQKGSGKKNNKKTDVKVETSDTTDAPVAVEQSGGKKPATRKPKAKATLRAWKSCRPTRGSIHSLIIFSGLCSATSSISIPPSVLAMITLQALARSNKIDK